MTNSLCVWANLAGTGNRVPRAGSACSGHRFASASTGDDKRQDLGGSIGNLLSTFNCGGIYWQHPTGSPVIPTLPIQEPPTTLSHLPRIRETQVFIDVWGSFRGEGRRVWKGGKIKRVWTIWPHSSLSKREKKLKKSIYFWQNKWKTIDIQVRSVFL